VIVGISLGGGENVAGGVSQGVRAGVDEQLLDGLSDGLRVGTGELDNGGDTVAVGVVIRSKWTVGRNTESTETENDEFVSVSNRPVHEEKPADRV
jgi:hypothetical protein